MTTHQTGRPWANKAAKWLVMIQLTGLWATKRSRKRVLNRAGQRKSKEYSSWSGERCRNRSQVRWSSSIAVLHASLSELSSSNSVNSLRRRISCGLSSLARVSKASKVLGEAVSVVWMIMGLSLIRSQCGISTTLTPWSSMKQWWSAPMGSSGLSSCAEAKLYVKRTDDKTNIGMAVSRLGLSRCLLYVSRDRLMCESAWRSRACLSVDWR